jgi:hypothetical protein
MDIDSTSSGGALHSQQQQQQRSIKIHPLAIIGISDHYTRIVSGGSALSTSSPVVGLLFGHYDTSGKLKLCLLYALLLSCHVDSTPNHIIFLLLRTSFTYNSYREGGYSN